MRRLIWLALVVFVAADLLVMGGVPVGGDGTDVASDAQSQHAHTAHAQAGPCWPSDIPLGALPGQPQPIWCYDPPETGSATISQGVNSWVDDFNHGLSLADLGPGYRIFGIADAGATERLNRFQYWRHADHWMVDVSGRDQTPSNGPWNYGGTTMRPDRSFRFENGRLIVEFDAAAGVSAYDNGIAWPEIVVTTAPTPTGITDELYGYGIYRGHWTFGCRLESGRALNCALFSSSASDGTVGNGRLYELPLRNTDGMSLYQVPTPNSAWRICQGTDPDTYCRDRFRLELTRDTINVHVNGVRQFGASQIPPDRQLPPAMLNGDVYVYFSSWLAKPNADTVRFHWDRISINNGASSPPEPGPGPGPAPISCSPRPAVNVSTAPAGSGRLQVTVAAKTTSGVPNNRLRAIEVLSTKNAVTDIDGQTGRQGAFTVPLSGGPQQTTFVVRRATPGVAMTVPMKIVDDCGSWDTFVGAGPNAP